MESSKQNASTRYNTLAASEEQHLASKSIKVKTSKKITKKTILTTSISSNSTEENYNIFASQHQEKIINNIDSQSKKKPLNIEKQKNAESKLNESILEKSNIEDTNKIMNGKKKTKAKKNKKNETDCQGISVKSSFSKFDALQKKNLIHNSLVEKETNCRLCSKPVYKMEEIKAEARIYHKNCFRCNECNKQLKVDNYQSHEGILYCLVHFKLLFTPKYVEDNGDEKIRKPELIIRENQPEELPPGVIRASDKPDLGLEELQQLDVRSKFKVFENSGKITEDCNVSHHVTGSPVRQSTFLHSKLSKLQALGIDVNISERDKVDDDGSVNDGSESDETADDDNDDDLVRSKKSTQRERPVGLTGHAMSDIKTRFEKGHMMFKEERREERKQEIQNIRSRLFMGKQARIKEMYQQAVAESDQSITSANKKPNVELEGAARSLKERFESGEIFNDSRSENEAVNNRAMQNEADVFESAISKKSRCIFMELDANVAATGNQKVNRPEAKPQLSKNSSTSYDCRNNENELHVVKYDENPEDVKIETSEISSKFKFFETYRPNECKKKEFRITPPREGVVKMPTPDSDNETNALANIDTNILEKSQTTAKMLHKFREMENSKGSIADLGPKPLKCFTPPPDDYQRLYQNRDSDVDSEEDDDGDESEDEEQSVYKHTMDDEALQEAKTAARAKQLRAKFEKWEANEEQREINEGRADMYSQQIADDNIESTKIIRQRFENMKNLENSCSQRPRYQVNRFV